MISRRRFLLTTASASLCGPFLNACSALAAGSLDLQDATTLPFTLSDNHIIVEAAVAGKAQRFVFDTGGAATLTDGAFAALGLPARGSVELHGAGSGSVQAKITRVGVLTLGAATLRDADFLVLPDANNPLAGTGLSGILGREFFANFVLRIDYEARTLSLIPPAKFTPDPLATALALTIRHGGIPSIEAAIDGHVGRFDIDAGAGALLTLTRHFVKDNAIDHDFAKTIGVEIGRGIGGLITGDAARAKVFTLGAYSMENPLVLVPSEGTGGVFAERELAGNIGGAMLRRFTVTLDVSRNKLYLRPNAAFGSPFVFNRSGTFVQARGGSMLVSSVVVGSPAAEAGLRTGDVLKSVDGKPIARYSPADLREMFGGPIGTLVSLEFARGGDLQSAALTLRDLI